MLYTKLWEYRLGTVMMYFSIAMTLLMGTFAVLKFFAGDWIAFLYLGLTILNGWYVRKYYNETTEYRTRMKANG